VSSHFDAALMITRADEALGLKATQMLAMIFDRITIDSSQVWLSNREPKRLPGRLPCGVLVKLLRAG
jgi:hypothetical protein